MTERLGVLGLGRMGAALAASASAKGFGVSGWSRSGGDKSMADQAGYHLSNSFEDAVQRSDQIWTSLFDDAAVTEVLKRLAGLDLTGKLVVETSTVGPDVCRHASMAIEAAGGRLIDAPISGGPEMVTAGTMGLFIGGAENDVERVMPVATHLSNRVSHVGPLGAGAAAKIVNNVALAGAFGAAVEAMQLGQSMGLPLQTMLSFLERSPGTSPMFKARVPAIRGDDDTVGFSVAGAIKDGEVFLAEAERRGVELRAMAAVFSDFKHAAEAGHGEKDVSALVRFVLSQDTTGSSGS